jgi:hypothetical protein
MAHVDVGEQHLILIILGVRSSSTTCTVILGVGGGATRKVTGRTIIPTVVPIHVGLSDGRSGTCSGTRSTRTFRTSRRLFWGRCSCRVMLFQIAIVVIAIAVVVIIIGMAGWRSWAYGCQSHIINTRTCLIRGPGQVYQEADLQFVGVAIVTRVSTTSTSKPSGRNMELHVKLLILPIKRKSNVVLGASALGDGNVVILARSLNLRAAVASSTSTAGTCIVVKKSQIQVRASNAHVGLVGRRKAVNVVKVKFQNDAGCGDWNVKDLGNHGIVTAQTTQKGGESGRVRLETRDPALGLVGIIFKVLKQNLRQTPLCRTDHDGFWLWLWLCGWSGKSKARRRTRTWLLGWLVGGGFGSYASRLHGGLLRRRMGACWQHGWLPRRCIGPCP